jgi:cell wall-associated NlpC family hydrolase
MIPIQTSNLTRVDRVRWTRDFIGLPWQFAGRSRDGVDCWGLLWLIYRDVLHIEIASYAQETMDAPERDQIAALMAGELSKTPWTDIPLGQERAFDMAVFKRAGLDSHVGVVVEPGRMLHITQGTETRVEWFDQGRWKPKLIALHRHVSLNR